MDEEQEHWDTKKGGGGDTFIFLMSRFYSAKNK